MRDCDLDIVLRVPFFGLIVDDFELSPVFGVYDLVRTINKPAGSIPLTAYPLYSTIVVSWEKVHLTVICDMLWLLSSAGIGKRILQRYPTQRHTAARLSGYLGSNLGIILGSEPRCLNELLESSLHTFFMNNDHNEQSNRSQRRC